MSIRIFATGGTFEKQYNEITEKLHFIDTHLHEMLKLGRCLVPTVVEKIMLMDSLDMMPEHRNLIANKCLEATEDKIIITHGTGTMVETAKVLAEKVKNKTIVLTGAMIPYKFGASDGFFNLGGAMAFVQTLPQGIYIAMNGRYFHWNNCRKNVETGIFEEL